MRGLFMKQMKQIGKDQSFHVNQELEGSSQRRWTLIAAGILAAVLLLLILILFFFKFVTGIWPDMLNLPLLCFFFI